MKLQHLVLRSVFLDNATDSNSSHCFRNSGSDSTALAAWAFQNQPSATRSQRRFSPAGTFGVFSSFRSSRAKISRMSSRSFRFKENPDAQPRAPPLTQLMWGNRPFSGHTQQNFVITAATSQFRQHICVN